MAKQTLNISVSDSVVSDLPREYHGAVAVVAFIAAQTSIVHNQIGGCSCELRDPRLSLRISTSEIIE
eukprot:COSAG04_NODE_757_length_10542_cov_7.203773_9_plen_67_part_00